MKWKPSERDAYPASLFLFAENNYSIAEGGPVV